MRPVEAVVSLLRQLAEQLSSPIVLTALAQTQRWAYTQSCTNLCANMPKSHIIRTATHGTTVWLFVWFKSPTLRVTDPSSQDVIEFVAHNSSIPANRLRHSKKKNKKKNTEHSLSSYLVCNVKYSHLPNSARTELLHEE